MLSLKLFSVLLIASSLCNQSMAANENDWKVLNDALENINTANATVVKNSILNILSGFLPNGETATQAPTTNVTTAPVTMPTVLPTVTPSTTTAAPSPSLQQILQLYQILAAAQQKNSKPADSSSAIITQIFDHGSHEKCDCKKRQKSLAEFMVNVPCPTTTEKPAKKIVVKVPCPTTTTTEKPCECKCCPCNPCESKKSSKKHRKEEPCDDSSESKEVKTVVRTYEVQKKNDVRRPRPYFYRESSEEDNDKWQ